MIVLAALAGPAGAQTDTPRDLRASPAASAVPLAGSTAAGGIGGAGPGVAATSRNCTCRYFGQSYEVGAVLCLRGPAGPQLARCSMNQNITSWVPLAGTCPEAALPGASAPAG